MTTFDQAQERDMILFVGSYSTVQANTVAKLSKFLGRSLKACVLLEEPEREVYVQPGAKQQVTLFCDFSKDADLQQVLLPYKHRFLAVTCRGERNVPLLKKVIPHVPYLNTPTEKSLDWTTDKIKMRQMLRAYDKKIAPKFIIAHDSSAETVAEIEKKVGFPLIIKPAGLAASLLVTLCYHHEEFVDSLEKTVRKIEQIYKKKKGRGDPQILVEEYMEGTIYSIDSYVNQRGTVYHMPLVHVKTGRSVGYEDFFGYLRITPVNLKPYKIQAAHVAAEKAIEALNLRSTNCHIELMKTEDGWKIIEVGPRVGGFRHEMYELSYGMNHLMNDMLIRIPRKPILTKKVKGYTAVLQFYAREKGKLVSLGGVNKIRKLESFSRIVIKKKIGDLCDFAHNGDDPVFDAVLFNKSRSQLLADIRRLEQAVVIRVKKSHTNKIVSK